MDEIVGADGWTVLVARHGDRVAEGVDADLFWFIDLDIDGERVFHGAPLFTS